MRSYVLPLLITTASAAYVIQDDYAPANFANMFNFFTGDDPTRGYVNYVDQNAAQSSGLYKVQNNQVYIGVDHTNVVSSGRRGRDSVRLSSKKAYNHGLIVLDLAHMPGGQCGSWPAFWTLGQTQPWPNGGEIDIIEGVNSQGQNSMAVHTSQGCGITNTGGFSGSLYTSNCDVDASGQASNTGCAISSGNTGSYGQGFNAAGGGVYATEWTGDAISIWYFPRAAVPADLSGGTPNPNNWGLPMAKFAGACDWDSKVFDQQIMFDVTFCGDWAGGVWSSDSTCAAAAGGSSCQAYVQNNPGAFKETYWSINGLKVYQNNGAAVPSPSQPQSQSQSQTRTRPQATSSTSASTSPAVSTYRPSSSGVGTFSTTVQNTYSTPTRTQSPIQSTNAFSQSPLANTRNTFTTVTLASASVPLGTSTPPPPPPPTTAAGAATSTADGGYTWRGAATATATAAATQTGDNDNNNGRGRGSGRKNPPRSSGASRKRLVNADNTHGDVGLFGRLFRNRSRNGGRGF